MLTLVVVLVGMALLAYALAPLRIKALVSFLLMTQVLDLAPDVLFGMYVWDYGAILMLILGIEVYLKTPVVSPAPHRYMMVLRLMIGWLLACFAWSWLIDGYPIGHTIKASRHMMIGYPMALIYARLFRVEPESFEFLLKWLYRLTLLVMPVTLLQYVLQKPLLYGLYREYQGSLRSNPVFMPLCLLNFWIICARLLSGARASWHERCYLLLAMAVVALSFTRGLYLSVLLIGALMLALMAREHRLRTDAMVRLSLVALPLLVVMLATGMAQRIGERTLTALHLVGGDTGAVARKDLDDSFHGRLLLAGERFQLAFERNPLVGFAFIHEDDVPPELRARLHYGSVVTGNASNPNAFAQMYAFTDRYVLALYSADIAWADVVIATGPVGVGLLVWLLISLIADYWKHPNDAHPLGYPVKVGLFAQTLVMFLLMFDGDSFFGMVHIPAFLLAGYSLSGIRREPDPAPVTQLLKPANLLT